MSKRKVTEDLSAEGSDLSPPPNDLEDVAIALANENDSKLKERPAKARKTAPRSVTTNPKPKPVGKAPVSTQKKGTRGRDIKAEEQETSPLAEEAVGITQTKRQRKTRVVKKEETGSEEENIKPAPKRRTPNKAATEQTSAKPDEEVKPAEKPAKKKRKTKEEKEAEAMPLAARTVGHKLFIGAHVSSAGGVQNAPLNSVHIGANAFALFLKSQRKWANPPLQTEQADGFHANCKHHSYKQNEHVVPHGSYLVNLAHTDPVRTTQAYDAFVDDLKRCERLGIRLYNFHPGVANSTNGDKAKAIAHLASNINRAHAETSTVVTLLENMAAGGNVLGSTFEDLRDMIALIDDKSRVGVCLDTCHAFAGGYDLRTPEAFSSTMDEFERLVGVKYLRALHLNDSKAPFQSHRDLHANIGTGFLGLRAFHNIVNDTRFAGLPLVLETPIEVRDVDGQLVKDEKGKDKEDKGIWATEIKLLESMVGMDVESEEFLKLEADLARKGKPERDRLWDQIEKKKEKEAAKGTKKGKAKSKKENKRTDEYSESELSDVKSEDDK